LYFVFQIRGCYASRWIHNFIFTVVKALLLRLDVTTGYCGWDLNIPPLLRRKYDSEISFGQNFVCQSLFCQWHVPLTFCFYRQSQMPIWYRSNLQRVRSSRHNLPGKIQTIVRSLTLTAKRNTVSEISSFLRWLRVQNEVTFIHKFYRREIRFAGTFSALFPYAWTSRS